MYTKALTETKSPVTSAELNDWLRGIDGCDPMLDVSLKAATGYIIDYLELELLTRERLTVFKDWPIIGTPTSGLSRTNSFYKTQIEIPYANLITMDSVTIFGELSTAYTLFVEHKPSVIDLSECVTYTDNDEPAIKLQYKAGFGGADDVPSDIKIGIMMLAGYIFDHRGACDMTEALSKSGAKSLIQSYKVNAVTF